MSEMLHQLLNSQFKYVVAFCGLFVCEWLFLLIARRFHIGADVSERSSHSIFTPTCGGIIFVFAAIAFASVNYAELGFYWWLMLAGALLLGVVSFVDDLHPLKPLPRLFLQIFVMGVSFSYLLYPEAIAVYLLIIICGVFCINSFNFIDGICGMLAMNGIVIISSILYVVHVVTPDISPLYGSICVVLLLALVVFALFNLPDKIFAGDVGSVTLGFFVAFLILNIIMRTQDVSLVVLIIVVLVDACMTTLQRLFAGENILLPHREFIYEVLTSRWRLPHLVVSLTYALLQLLINALYFLIPEEQHYTYLIIVISLLIVSYFAVRRSPRSRSANV